MNKIDFVKIFAKIRFLTRISPITQIYTNEKVFNFLIDIGFWL